MKHVLQFILVLTGLLFSTVTLASTEVEKMSDIEVSEYAARMAEVMDKIKNRQLCGSHDASCVRDEFARNGISYDDKVLVQKRLAPMIGTMY